MVKEVITVNIMKTLIKPKTKKLRNPSPVMAGKAIMMAFVMFLGFFFWGMI